MANKELVVKYRGAGNPQVFEKTLASLRQIGNDLPGTLDLNNERARATNRACNFEGDKYAVQNYKVYKLSASGTWDLDFTPAVSIGATYEGVVGLYPALVGSDPFLYYIWRGTSGTNRMTRKSSKFTGAGSWGSEVVGTNSIAFGNNSALSDAIQVGNAVYFNWGGYTQAGIGGISDFYVADLQTNTLGEVKIPPRHADTNPSLGIPHANAVFDSWNGKVYTTYYRGQNISSVRLSSAELVEIQGSLAGTTSILSFISDNTTGLAFAVDTADSSHRPVLFNDKTDMFAFVWESGHTVANEFSDVNAYDGWCARRVVDSGGILVIEDITNSVLPVAIRRNNGAGGGSAHWTGRWGVNTQVDGSGNFSILLNYTDNGAAGSQSIIYKWIDKDTQLELLDIGTDPSLSTPHYSRGGGTQESAPIQSSIEDVRENTSIAGDVEIDIRFIGSGQAITFGLLYDENKEVVNKFATLRSSTSGTVAGDGKTVSGITVDSGNIITLSWKAESDFVPNGKSTGLNPVIYLV